MIINKDEIKKRKPNYARSIDMIYHVKTLELRSNIPVKKILGFSVPHLNSFLIIGGYFGSTLSDV